MRTTLRLLCASLCVAYAMAGTRAAVPEFEIDLGLAPEDRFTHVIEHFKPALSDLYSNLVNNSIVLGLANKVVAARGPENDELMAELTGIAETVGWPIQVVQSAQILYEVQTLMVPITNFSWAGLNGAETQAMIQFLNQRSVSFGCTGIIGRRCPRVSGPACVAVSLDCTGLCRCLFQRAQARSFNRSGVIVARPMALCITRGIWISLLPNTCNI